MKGYVNSFESFSTLDGPGIRSVVFLQGCPLRCLYCHNPETWDMAKGILMDSSEAIKRVLRNANYISINGGITISGGEPTYQIDFLRELLQGFKKNGLHTAVDTSGYVEISDIEKIMEYTDLFIADIKHMDPEYCRRLTGKTNSRALKLLEYLSLYKKEVWVRSVMVKGYTDNRRNIYELLNYVKGLNNVTRFELLPYHSMAVGKYKELGFEYKLKDVPEYSAQEIKVLNKAYI